MNFEKDDRVLGLWFCAGNEQDLMITAVRRGELVIASLRFRYYNPELFDPFAGKDKKSGYSVEVPVADQALLMGKLHWIADLSVRGGFAEMKDFIPEGTVDEVLAALRQKEWCHMKTVPKPTGAPS